MAKSSQKSYVIDKDLNSIRRVILDPTFASSLRIDMKSENPMQNGVWYRFHHGTTFTSWGEKITITLTVINNNSTSVHIHSECGMPTQIVDWGKNTQNIHAIIECMERYLGTHANFVLTPPQPVPPVVPQPIQPMQQAPQYQRPPMPQQNPQPMQQAPQYQRPPMPQQNPQPMQQAPQYQRPPMPQQNPQPMQQAPQYQRPPMPQQNPQPAQNQVNFCYMCGTKAADGDVFCTNCGHKLR